MYAQGLISSPNLDNDQLVVEAKAALRRLKLQLLEGQLQLTTGTATAYSQFEAARAQLDAGWQEYQAGVQQLADSRAEYETQKADAQQKLDECDRRATVISICCRVWAIRSSSPSSPSSFP